MDYKLGQFNKEAGFRKLKQWLNGIGRVVWSLVYTPMHDLYGHFEFLHDQGFTIVLCPIKTGTNLDITDPRLIEDVTMLINKMGNIKYLCLGSGDKHFAGILQIAKDKGIKIAIVYGSEKSLSREIRDLADVYPVGHLKEGQQMLHFFSPTND